VVRHQVAASAADHSRRYLKWVALKKRRKDLASTNVIHLQLNMDTTTVLMLMVSATLGVLGRPTDKVRYDGDAVWYKSDAVFVLLVVHFMVQ